MKDEKAVEGCVRPPLGPKSGHFPDLVVVTHENRKALFYDDLLRGKTVLIHFMSIRDDSTYHLVENIAKVQLQLGDRLGRDVFIYSITVNPEQDTPDALQAYAEKYSAQPGWIFLTGQPSVIETIRGRLFAHGASPDHGSMEDCSLAMIRYGNEATGLWGSVPSTTDPAWIAKRLSWVESRPPVAAGQAKRKGPLPLTIASVLLLAAALLPSWQLVSIAQQDTVPAAKRTMQPQFPPSVVTEPDDHTTQVVTSTSTFPESDPWVQPPGSNMLPTIYTNTYGSDGVEIPNTLPSTPVIYYNLHVDEPKVTLINNTPVAPSPQDDLKAYFTAIVAQATILRDGGPGSDQALTNLQTSIEGALDVLEGNPTKASRAYSGLPLLHWKSGSDIKVVDPTTANVDIHQVWYDSHIESDTAYIDARNVKMKPWTITYTIDTLTRGHDDFSPYVMYFDNATAPSGMPMPGVGMDQSFFNMEDGTKTIIKIEMAPAKNWSLTYTWGWRDHPPRAQVTENACKTLPFDATAGAACSPDPPPGGCETSKAHCTMPAWERDAFYKDGKEDKEYAINQLSKYAPARVMWFALRDAQEFAARKEYQKIIDCFTTIRNEKTGEPGIAQQAWQDWRDRSKLPRNLPKKLMDTIMADKDSDLSLVYMNNTIYARFTDGGRMDFPKWTLRGTWLKVALYNLDYFDHGYQNVDFGGARGWENQFKSSVKAAGSGCWFTFGRNFWTMNIPQTPTLTGRIPETVTVPAAIRAPTRDGEDQFGWHKVRIQYNYEPSRRVRFYQFDPVHHNVAIFSVH
jgi:SCO1/SenC